MTKKKQYTKESYRNKIHSIIAKDFKAKIYGGWTKKQADDTFDEDYWEEYRKEGQDPKEALNNDSSYWED